MNSKSTTMSVKDKLAIAFVFILSSQWIFLRFLGIHLPEPFNAIAPGLAIFGAAYILTWGAELSVFEIPQALAISFLALVAVLPEYAVDMYFAWEAGTKPEYIHFATANMTGANRMLIGVGWSAVVFAVFLKFKKKEIRLEPSNRIELLALSIASVYCLSIPFKSTLSYIDSIFLLSLFAWYMWQATRAERSEPEVEGPIESMADWARGQRIAITVFFFLFSGFTIFIAAEPFAEGLLSSGRKLGIEEFILVQWLAPLASEAPEFIIAILFALRGRATQSLSTLVSSKVNQWTLLVGMLPLVYSLSTGQLNVMHLDARQAEEILLTVAQSVFAIILIANLRFSLVEALFLFILFITQLFFTSTEARIMYSYVYFAIAMVWLLALPANRKGVIKIWRDGFKHPKNIV